MAEGKLQPADFEDGELPEPEAPDFDLSDETIEHNGDDRKDNKQSEIASSGEPEGVFALFDREFPPGVREPIEEEESTAFDAEFSESFETMFTAVKGDGSAPLFDSKTLEPLGSGEAVGSPEPDGAAMPLPIPKLDPEDDPGGRLSPIPAAPSAPGAREAPKRESSFLDDDEEEYSEPSELPELEPLLSLDEPQEDNLLLDEEDDFPELLSLDEPGDADFQFDEDGDESPLTLSNSEDEDEPLDGLGAWDGDDSSLEEFSFDESEEEELFDTDLGALPGQDADDGSDDFDDFARMALGLESDEDEDEDEDPLDEDEDFIVEDLDGAQELDPFEDVAIMSSEDVSKFESPFGEEELKFVEEEALPDDEEDPFRMEGDNSHEEESLELDPFGEDAQALAESKGKSENSNLANEEPEDGEAQDKPKRKSKPSKARGGSKGSPLTPLIGLFSLPWRLYSSLAGILFGVLEAVVGLLARIPLIGIPFRILGGLLSSVPLLWKKLIVLFLLVALVWGGGFAVGSLLPKPGTTVELPDSGGAKFSNVELADGRVTGEIENTGETNLQLFPGVTVADRELLNPGTWFSPTELGSCEGELVEVPIDATIRVVFDCGLDGGSLKPSLRE